jgi:hypothetical protein
MAASIRLSFFEPVAAASAAVARPSVMTTIACCSAKMGDRKTKMCMSVANGVKCKYGEKCQFAHNISELTLVGCRFGIRCRSVRQKGCGMENIEGSRCMFVHPTETKESYGIRVGLTKAVVKVVVDPVAEAIAWVQKTTPPPSPPMKPVDGKRSYLEVAKSTIH